MTSIYYPTRFRLDHKDRYLIWHSSMNGEEPDGVVVNADGLMPVFRDGSSLFTYAAVEGLSPVDENQTGLHNLDSVVRWLERKRPAELDCVEFLNAWNLFGDLSATVGGIFNPDGDKTHKIYGKLFWGCNLPSMTPPGKCYVPLWPGRESRIIREVMSEGLRLFRSRIWLQREAAHSARASGPADRMGV